MFRKGFGRLLEKKFHRRFEIFKISEGRSAWDLLACAAVRRVR